MRLSPSLVAVLAINACILNQASAFYLPGVAPTPYEKNDTLNVKVTPLTSVRSQLGYDYYRLPFCKPEKVESVAESLGEVLTGERMENSVYNLVVLKNETCKQGCTKTYSPDEIELFLQMAVEQYRINMVLDNLPAAEIRTLHTVADNSQEITTYTLGIPLAHPEEVVTTTTDAKGGEAGHKEYYLNNHVHFVVYYHQLDNETAHSLEQQGNLIVGFEVHSYSIQHQWKDRGTKKELITCSTERGPDLTIPKLKLDTQLTETEVIWTYDVTWKHSSQRWVSRWDVYLQINDDQIHWFSIINSLVVLIFLTGMVAMIMMRILHKDLTRYNEVDQSEEAREVREETGWKLVFGDVFRPPKFAQILAVYIGSGVQVFSMVMVTIVFALLGFLSPSNRGALMTAMVLLFVLLGGAAGFWSARFCKMFKCTDRKKNTLLTSFMVPGVVFSVFLVLDIFIWAEKSTGAVPFGTIFALIVLWFGISVPLVFLGSYLGFRKDAIENPVRTNSIPRQIPDQVWYMKPLPSILMGGILPFGAVFVELFFILNSIWQHRFYYLFGFLFLVFVILILTSAEITIVMCYFQLCSEDYHWWWRAFFTAGSSSVYLFVYSVYYWATRAKTAKFVAGLSYLGYVFILSYVFFVLTGFIGFISCFWFVRKIYASVKID